MIDLFNLLVMKTIKLFLKPISYLLTFLILLQGCMVYKRTGVTLEEASKTEEKVKVEKIDGKKIKFSRIMEGNDGIFYGIGESTSRSWSDTSTLLNENDIAKVQIKDRKNSTIKSIILPVVIVGLLIAVAKSQSSGYGPAGW